MIFVLVLIGCSNEKEAADVSEDRPAPTPVTNTTTIDKKILQDTKIISDILQEAMDYRVINGETEKKYEKQMDFFFDKEHYYGLTVNEDKYSPEEYALLIQANKIYTDYFEYIIADIKNDELAKEQIMLSFNRTMDTINATLNKIE